MAESRGEITLEIKGLKEISESLKGLPHDLAQKVLDQATRSEVVKWQEAASELAPEGEAITVKFNKGGIVNKKGELFAKHAYIHVPGTLKKSIKVKKIKSAVEGSSGEYESRFGIKILGKAFYWKFVEFGSVHNRPPKPFLRPTFAALAESSLRAIAVKVQTGIEKYFAAQNKGTPK